MSTTSREAADGAAEAGAARGGAVAVAVDEEFKGNLRTAAMSKGCAPKTVSGKREVI
jgi:hypothetical protein